MRRSLSRIPDEAWPSVIDQLEERVMTLELNLRQMSSDKRLKKSEFSKRKEQIIDFKKRIHQLKNLANARKSDLSHDWRQLIPHPDRCSPLEKKICQNYFKELEGILKSVIKDNDPVVRWMEKIAESGLGLTGIFLFSKLRRKVSISQKYLSHSKNLEKKTQQRASACIRGVGELAASQNHMSVRSLIQIFDKLESVLGQIISLDSMVRKKNAQIAWAKNWINRQEARMAEYNPFQSVSK